VESTERRCNLLVTPDAALFRLVQLPQFLWRRVIRLGVEFRFDLQKNRGGFLLAQGEDAAIRLRLVPGAKGTISTLAMRAGRLRYDQ
jgi:hypothetical protein